MISTSKSTTLRWVNSLMKTHLLAVKFKGDNDREVTQWTSKLKARRLQADGQNDEESIDTSVKWIPKECPPSSNTIFKFKNPILFTSSSRVKPNEIVEEFRYSSWFELVKTAIWPNELLPQPAPEEFSHIQTRPNGHSHVIEACKSDSWLQWY